MTYDPLGRVIDTVDPLTHTTHSDYDALGRPITVTMNYVSGGPLDNQTNLRTVTQYDAASNRVKVTDPKGIAAQFQYDLLNRLVTVTDALAGTTRYGYDAASNLLTITDANTHTITHTYDLLNRLLSMTDPLTHTTVYTYDIANRLINVGGQAYSWDNNGNLLADGVFTYTYDAANRPITIKQGTTLTYTYNYNGLGDRFKQVVNGVPTTYTLDLNA